MEKKKNKQNQNIGQIDSKYLIRNLFHYSFILTMIMAFILMALHVTEYFFNRFDMKNENIILISDIIKIAWTICLITLPIGMIMIYLYTKAYMNRFSYEISDKFIVIYSGVFISNKITIPFSRIQNINIYQNISDKLFKLHSAKIETAGSSNDYSGSEGFIPGLLDPSPLEKIINKLVNKYTQEPYKDLQGRIFENPDLAFDEFAAYFLRKLQEGSETQNQIEKLREEKNISREELANKIGVSRQTIYYLEKGKYQPSLKIAMLLEEALGVSIQEMFTLTDSDRKKAEKGDK